MVKNELSFDGTHWVVYDAVNQEKYTYHSKSFAEYMKGVFDQIDKEEAEHRYQTNVLEIDDLDKADFEIW